MLNIRYQFQKKFGINLKRQYAERITIKELAKVLEKKAEVIKRRRAAMVIQKWVRMRRVSKWYSLMKVRKHIAAKVILYLLYIQKIQHYWKIYLENKPNIPEREIPLNVEEAVLCIQKFFKTKQRGQKIKLEQDLINMKNTFDYFDYLHAKLLENSQIKIKYYWGKCKRRLRLNQDLKFDSRNDATSKIKKKKFKKVNKVKSLIEASPVKQVKTIKVKK